jgi:hypothetical protein
LKPSHLIKCFQDSKSSIVCVLNESLFSRGGSSGCYRLTISGDQIRIVAPDLVGLHNAIMTLVQVRNLLT